MSIQVQDMIARGDARIVEAPVRHQVEVDRNFGLPSSFYGITVGCYLSFLAITAVAFASPILAIPMVIFAFSILAGFLVPTIWTRLKGNDSRPLSMDEFGRKGVMTLTGRLAPRDAAIQVLILPVLVVVWGLVAVTMAILVR